MDKEILLDKIKLIESENSSLTELLENSDKEGKLPFKIISVFRPIDRLEEYVREIGDLPRVEGWSLDYWQIGIDLCEKDGGHAPSMDELAQLASYIYGEEIDSCEDKFDLTVKNKIKDLDPSSSDFYLWSSEENGSYGAYRRYFDPTCTDYDYGYDSRNNSGCRFVCLGDE